MNQRERDIGARLKEFREGMELSQAAFSKLLGTTQNQIASIEYGRTPMTYELAWSIRQIFFLSIDWLWGGDMPPDALYEDEGLPHPYSVGIKNNALLTKVFDDFYNLHGVEFHVHKKSERGSKVKLEKLQINHRELMRVYLALQAERYLALIPDGHTLEFSEKTVEFMGKFFKQFPEDKREVISARMEALLWAKMRSSLNGHLSAAKRSPKQLLTDSATDGKKLEVKPRLPSLLERLNKATMPNGKMSELAAWLDVPLASVSRWLSGKREPGGEITLRLLHWVEKQERQK